MASHNVGFENNFLKIYGALDSLFSMGRIGIGIANTLGNENNISRASGLYESQMAINQNIADFNRAVASRAGDVAISGVLKQTEQLIGSIKEDYSRRGVEFEGSPKMMVEAAATMGMHAAYEAAYDTEVKMVNIQLHKEAQNRRDAARLQEYDFMGRQNRSNLVDQIFGGMRNIGTDLANTFLRNRQSSVAPRPRLADLAIESLQQRTISNQV